jgi:hypothetical protein
MMMAKSLALVALILTLSAAGAPDNGIIEITAISCGSSIVPQLSIQHVTGDPNRDFSERVALTFKNEVADVFTARALVPEGMYLVGSNSETCRMRSPIPLALLKGTRRELFTVLHNDKIVSLREWEPQSVAVRAVNQDIGLELFVPGRAIPRLPSWSGTNAYFDGVPDGRDVLEVSISDAAVCIPVLVPSAYGSIAKVSLDLETLARLFANDSGRVQCPKRGATL